MMMEIKMQISRFHERSAVVSIRQEKNKIGEQDWRIRLNQVQRSYFGFLLAVS